MAAITAAITTRTVTLAFLCVVISGGFHASTQQPIQAGAAHAQLLSYRVAPDAVRRRDRGQADAFCMENVKILNISGPNNGSGDQLPSHHAIRAARLPVSPQTATTFAILGACGTLLWVMLSVLGYVHEEPRVALQQAGPLMMVALPR
jgi:hypothetical protein